MYNPEKTEAADRAIHKRIFHKDAQMNFAATLDRCRDKEIKTL